MHMKMYHALSCRAHHHRRRRCADNPIQAQYRRLNLPVEVVEAMPPKRRTLFRGVWGAGDEEFNTFWHPGRNHAL
jgi:hypothetical protein